MNERLEQPLPFVFSFCGLSREDISTVIQLWLKGSLDKQMIDKDIDDCCLSEFVHGLISGRNKTPRHHLLLSVLSSISLLMKQVKLLLGMEF